VSTELLRRAAALMRERAEACRSVFGGEFTSTPSADRGWPWTLRNGEHVLATGLDSSDAHHIASWHPDVAIATAFLLEYLAGFEEQMNGNSGNLPDAMRWKPHGWGAALDLARAYLGESA
jgi:hypothetical protein